MGTHHYLAYADRLMGWLEVAGWQVEPTSHQDIGALRKLFVVLGVPVVICSDNGPQFASAEYATFLANW